MKKAKNRLLVVLIFLSSTLAVQGQQVIAPSNWTVEELEIACNSKIDDSESDSVKHAALLLGACRGYIEGVASVMLRNCISQKSSGPAFKQSISRRYGIAASEHWHFLHGLMSFQEWVVKNPDKKEILAFDGIRMALEADYPCK